MKNKNIFFFTIWDKFYLKVISLFIMICFTGSLFSVIEYDFRTNEKFKSDESLLNSNKIYLKLRSEYLSENKNEISSVNSLNNFLKNNGLINFKNAFKSKSKNLNCIYELEFEKSADLSYIINSLKWFDCVEYSERIPKIFVHDVPNDAMYSSLQHLPQIMASEAWDIHKGEDSSTQVIVAIVDSGVEWRHPDLVNNIWNNLGEDADNDGHTIEYINNEWVFDPGDINGIDDDGNGFIDDFVGWNFINEMGGEDNDPSDIMSHGTHCAGISAGVTNNEIGISSISWNVDVMCLKHDIDGGNAFESNTYDGVIYASENGADVISMSWGCMIYSKAHEEVIAYADSLGSILISSAGNENWALSGYPSSYPHIISVASVASNDHRAYYSSYGIAIDISAPGGDMQVDGGILSTVVGGNYARYQGTSMAGPLVAGLTALIKSAQSDLNQIQVKYQLLSTADNIDEQNPNFLNMLGSGRINAFNALTEDVAGFGQPLRLEVSRVILDNPINSFNETNISLELRNYADFSLQDNINISLTCDNENINIIDGEANAIAVSDGYIFIEDAFSIILNNSTENQIVNFTLHIDANQEISYGNELSFTLPITQNHGVFVWDHSTTTSTSGFYISNFLEEKNVDAIYNTYFDFPQTLVGFDAVFLSFGNSSLYPYYDYPPNFDDKIALIVDEYLMSGGNLYVEGNNAMIIHGDGMWLPNLAERLSLYGLQDVNDGENNALNNLLGMENTFTEGLEFNSYQTTYESIDLYSPNETGNVIFVEDGYGNVGVSNEGEFNQKTICFSYCLSALNDNYNSSKEELLFRILDFFEVPYLVPDFSSDVVSGNAPLTVNFSNLTNSFPEDISWEWDIGNDNLIESYDENFEIIIPNPGFYDVSLTSSNGIFTQEIVKEDYLRVFDGQSSLMFYDVNSELCIPASENITLGDNFTIECWIYPRSMGYIPNVGMGTIFSKGSFSIMTMEHINQNYDTIAINIKDVDGNNTLMYSESDILSLNFWNHIAVTNSPDSGLKLFINGSEKQLSNNDFNGIIEDNVEDNLYFGKGIAPNRTFIGNIDECRLWNVERTGEQILDLMFDESVQPDEHLVGYWNLNEANGDVANDFSGNNNNGIVSNCLWHFGFMDNNSNEENEISSPKLRIYNYPNPFILNGKTRNLYTTIFCETSLKLTSPKLQIFNLKGQLIKEINDNTDVDKGVLFNWDGRNSYGEKTSSGIYLYRVIDKKFESVPQKMILIK